MDTVHYFWSEFLSLFFVYACVLATEDESPSSAADAYERESVLRKNARSGSPRFFRSFLSLSCSETPFPSSVTRRVELGSRTATRHRHIHRSRVFAGINDRRAPDRASARDGLVASSLSMRFEQVSTGGSCDL